MLIRIETGSGTPISRQIADQIRAQCAGGVLAPGERLPSVRELARQLAVNPNTIQHIYERLTLEGVLERRHGDGTFVATGNQQDQKAEQMELLNRDVVRLVERAAMLGVDESELHGLIEKAASGRRESVEAKEGQS